MGEIYDIEPSATEEGIRLRYFNLKDKSVLLRHIEIEGGNAGFYNKWGGKALKDVINSVCARVIEKSKEMGINSFEITSRYGDVYVISSKPIGLEPVKTEDEDHQPLEVKLIETKVE